MDNSRWLNSFVFNRGIVVSFLYSKRFEININVVGVGNGHEPS